MKRSNHYSNRRVFLYLSTVLLIFTSVCSAASWYIDPVNGNDAYDGSSPFHISNTPIGPHRTLGLSALVANDYDILILLDGAYSGLENVGQSVFDNIDSKHLTVTSMYGPENCILELNPQTIYLDSDSKEEMPKTTFQELTFTSSGTQAGSYFTLLGCPQFQDCIFTEFCMNSPGHPMIEIGNSFSPPVVFSNCQFTHNQVFAVIGSVKGHFICEDCIFEYNLPTNFGIKSLTIIAISQQSSGVLRNCTIRNHTLNNSSFTGIQITEDTDSDEMFMTDIEDCVIENNICYTDDEHCVGVECYKGSININNTRIENMKTIGTFNPSLGAAVSALDPTRLSIYSSTFKNNATGIRLFSQMSEATSSVNITDCEISGYHTEFPLDPDQFVGIYLDFMVHNFDIQISNCDIHTFDYGIFAPVAIPLQSFKLENCLIRDNQRYGFNLFNANEASTLIIKNCTFAQNDAFGVVTSNSVISNCIFHNNGTSIDGSSIQVNYSNVENGWTGSGIGNINADPLFADGGQYWPTHPEFVLGTDFHLKSTAGRFVEIGPMRYMLAQDDVDSPCIDGGDPADPIGDETQGSGGRINMGVYGGTWFASLSDLCTGGDDGHGLLNGDINRDCVVDLADIALMAANWLQSTVLNPATPE